MMHQLSLLILPVLFLADYLALVFWLLRTADAPPRELRYSMRTLLVAMTVVAVHLATFTVFLSAHSAR